MGQLSTSGEREGGRKGKDIGGRIHDKMVIYTCVHSNWIYTCVHSNWIYTWCAL